MHELLDRSLIGRHGAGVVHMDLAAADILPANWQLQLFDVVNRRAVWRDLTSDTPTSLERPGAVIHYRLVTGDIVAEEARWLDDLYRTTLVELATAFADEEMRTAEDLTCGININVLEQHGARYELHTDSNPLTGILFVTSHDQRDGGALRFDGPEETIELHPQAGDFVLFHATSTPHFVTPLVRHVLRVSIPMNFYTKAGGAIRPAGLDESLYGSRDNRSVSRTRAGSFQ
jgi:hypothetical protein